MAETGLAGTFEKAGTWLSSGISSLGQRTRTMATPATSSTGMRVFQPRNTTSIVISKGLTNAPGENNCFLNSAVQVLWHLDVFRRSFRDMAGHACMGKACIFCALKVLFTQLQYGEEKALPPDALRKALASAFKDEQRFQLRCMDDAAECFENILVRIHFHLAHDVKEDLCDAKHCVSHQKFAMTLIEHCVCPCGATSEPFPFTQMVHYVSCTALCGEAKKQKDRHHLSSGSAFFGQLLRSAGAIGDVRACPSECGKKVHIRRVLMNCPDVVGIGLVWDSDRPSVDHIMDVISCLGTTLRLPDLFNSVVDDQAKEVALNLVGVVTYYGKHYSTFFYNTRRKLWIYFDDASVKQVGPNWRDVAERCRRGHFQPLLLLYANRNGQAVDISTAPKETHILPGYQNMESPDKPPASTPFSSGHYRSKSMPGPSGGRLDSTGAMYKPVSSIPEFSANSRSSETDGAVHNKWNSVVEIGHDAVGGLTKEMQHQLSIDRERSHDIRAMTRQNQQQALAMAGFDCSKEYEERRNATARNQALEAAGFIEARGIPQPLLGGNYNQKYSNTGVINRKAEPSDLIGQYDADCWARSDGSKTLPRPGVLQASKTSARYPKGYRKPQNGGGAPQSNTELARTLFESNQSKPLVRHESWNGKSSKSIPLYENVVDGAIASDEVDNAEGNVTLQSRHSNYTSTPDLQRNLLNSAPQHQHSYYDTNKQLNNRTDTPSLNRCGSQPDLQQQNQNSQEPKGFVKRKASLTKSASADSDIYGSMPNLQRPSSTPITSTQHIAPQGILADAIKNDQENRRIMSNIATLQSNSSSPDSKRSSQASQASTFTVDSADTSRSSGSSKSTGSLRSKYGIASGFVTLPRKKRISDFAEGMNPQQDRLYMQNNMRQFMQRSQSDPPMPVSQGPPQLQQQNSAPAQFAGVFIDDDEGKLGVPSRQPSHLQHFAQPEEIAGKRTDPLEEGSVGSKDSGYRSSRDRSSASSGSVYSVDSPTADTPPMPIPHSPQNLATSPISPGTARQNVEGMCISVGIDVDELMDKCQAKESEGDLAMALCLCTSAVTKLKSTLKMTGMSDTTRHYLQTKYNTTVIRSRSLHKRLQIARQTQRLDSLEGVMDDRPTSVQPINSHQQPTRPASTQPILSSHHQQTNLYPTQTIPSRSHQAHSSYNTQLGTHQREHRPVQHMYNAPTHATDPRTGQYRPHSAQLPRKQYEFNASAQQGYPRHPTNGIPGDRYRRSSEGGETGPWGGGAPNLDRNPPRRSVVEVLTTHTTRPSLEGPMSDPLSSDRLCDDTITSCTQRGSSSNEVSGRNSPFNQFVNNSPANNSQNHVTHSKPAPNHAPVQFANIPVIASTEPCCKTDLTNVARNITKHGKTNLDQNSQHQNTGAKSKRGLNDGSKSSRKDLNQRMKVELEEFGCSTVKRSLPAQSTKYGDSSAKGVSHAKRGKPVRYVIEIHTMKTIPETESVNGGSCKKT